MAIKFFLEDIDNIDHKALLTKRLIKTLPYNLRILITKIEYWGYEVRIVGGAVRDFLLGKAPRDIDLATTARPEEILYIIEKDAKREENITSAYGIRHGTIVVNFDNEEAYEITSLGYNIKESGNRLEISYGNPTWGEDAKRRDFTMNALYVDMDGKLHDYLGGIDDLKKEQISFIGNYEERIQENKILAFRFFKILGKFENPKYDPKIIDYILNNKNAILQEVKDLSKIWMVQDIMSQPYYFENCDEILKEFMGGI